ncbi:hypothetical protein BC832DRAFT_588753 [Gaertneriomyces semiglobifer]|nr:hypothetical protein BC832DRAFT_588753 [Gaertneriomyces semiglobifer]
MTKAEVDVIQQPYRLPSGLELPNRLVKAAMTEGLAKTERKLPNNMPNDAHDKAYRRWGDAGWGLIITGNVQVDSTHLGTGVDVAVRRSDLDDPMALERWASFAAAAKGSDARRPTPAIVQLCHTGRQSPRGSGRGIMQPNKAPSAVPVQFGTGVIDRGISRLIFGDTRAMTEQDLDATVDQFVAGAEMSHQAGFDGVQLHGAHGYLLAQFMSPKTNQRTDAYGYHTQEKGLKLFFRIVDAIRVTLPKTFTVGVKLNSQDYVDGGLTEEDALEQIRLIIEHGGVDFIEISGGTYENPVMMGKNTRQGPEPNNDKALRKSKPREAFFTGFSRRACERHPEYTFMLTGGFRHRAVMAAALSSGACQLIGIGRPACVFPDVPQRVLNPDLDSGLCIPEYDIRGSELYQKLVPIKMVGAGVGTIWHQWQIGALALSSAMPDPQKSVLGLFLMLYGGGLAKVLFQVGLSLGLALWVTSRIMPTS